MYSLLLVIIYLAFISLGLPDSLIGSAWPIMHLELDVPISYAGIITMIISFGTIISSLMSDRLTKRFGANLVTATSVLMTAVALWGYSISSKFWMLCVFAIPYGLGAGGVDAALNNYVALHYKARHMSWLHCFWGVGASISPYIMGYSLTTRLSWPGGFRIVSVIQLTLTAALFLTLPLWKINKNSKEKAVKQPKRFNELFQIKGLPLILIAFFCYCAAESTAMLWSSSYLVKFRNMGEEIAAMLASLFFLGITFGRFVSGFISEKLGDKNMIRLGVSIMFIGISLIAIPDKYNICSMIGLVVTGLGCAPVYPSIIHSTPQNFGKENSQAIIGVQMASAYMASTFMPPLFGLLAQVKLIGLFPLYLFFFTMLLLIMTERLNKVVAITNEKKANGLNDQ
ncbi:MAG TPA: MFS transporter [Clostridia bacterium]